MLEAVKTKFFCEKEFWYIIELFDWQFVGDENKVIKKAVEYLSKKSEDSILLFEQKLRDKLQVLENCLKYEDIDHLDKDIKGLLNSKEVYFNTRCAVLAAGQKYFDSVLSNPMKIKENTEFQSLILISSKAVKLKNKKSLPKMNMFQIFLGGLY